MAKIKPIIQIEIDPANLVPELCAVISAVVPKQPEREVKLLEEISGALQRRIDELRGGIANVHKQVPEPGWDEKD